jgi:hypothetical protein
MVKIYLPSNEDWAVGIGNVLAGSGHTCQFYCKEFV